MGSLLEISGNYVYLLEVGKKNPSHKIIARLEKLETGADEKSIPTGSESLKEQGGGYDVSHHITTRSKLAAACVAHFDQYLNRTGDAAQRLEWTLEKLREVFPVNKWSSAGASMGEGADKKAGERGDEDKAAASP